MPQIPKKQFGVQEAQAPTIRSNVRGPQVNTRSQQINQSVRGIIRAATDIEENEIKNANRVAAFETDIALGELENKILYERENGLLNTKGKNAIGIDKNYQEQWKTGVEEIKKGLSNDDQVAAFEKNFRTRQNNHYRTLNKHMTVQVDAHDKQVTSTYVNQARSEAIKNFNNPELIAQSLEKQQNAIQAMGEKYGQGSNVIKFAKQASVSQTHLGVVNKFLNSGGDQEAKAYFENIKETMTEDDLSKATKLLEEGTLTGDAQRAVDANFQKTGDASDLLGMARSIKDEKLRDEVVKRTKSRLSDIKSARQFEQEDNFNTAYGVVEQTQSMDSIPVEVRAGLSLRDKQALEKRVQQLKSGEVVETDLDVYYELDQMAGDPKTRTKFKDMNLMTKRNSLSNADFKRFSSMQRELRSGKMSDKTQKLLDGIQTQKDVVNTALIEMGIPYSGKKAKSETVERANLFRHEVDKRVIQLQTKLGRKATTEEVRQIVEPLKVEAVKGAAWYNPLGSDEKRGFELKIDDVPGDDVKKIIDVYLRRQGRQPRPDEILNAYKAKLSAGNN